jgi:organic radical activating enzyme
MNDLEFRQQVLDTISDSFCGAKWYNATIWLGSGMTTSCHHPPAHKISIEDVQINPRALHNTPAKKQDRADMQAGRRPPGCEYCWKIEDMGRDAISDRVYKSRIYPIQTLHHASQLDPSVDVNLRTLEIAFDRTCQLACSYCNPAFSSTWVKDIKNSGPYRGLVSDGRNHFTHTHDSAQLYRFGEDNPYIRAFFEWWESDLHRTLEELRITGGEPLMSGYMWQLLDWFKENQGRCSTKLAINSNLALEKERLLEFLDSVAGLSHVEIYTSNEAVGAQSEYIRDGIDYNVWLGNMRELLEHDHIRAVHSMCTINALCLDSLPEYLEQVIEFKKQYGRERVNFTLNILRFPSFQSPLVLPDELRSYYKDRLAEFMVRHKGCDYMHEHEINHLQRLVDYLDVVKTPHSDAFEMSKLHNDFRLFYQQYDQRRGKDFAATFPRLKDWYDSIQLQFS